jgi:hypothetical protein
MANILGIVRHSAVHRLGEDKTGLADAGLASKDHPNSLVPVRLRATSLAALGRTAEVLAIADSLRVLGVGGASVGATLTDIGEELRAHGHQNEARAVVEISLAVQRGYTAAQRTTAAARGEVARALYVLDRWDEAHAIVDSLARESPNALAHVGRLGTIAARRGDRPGAMRIDSVLARDPRRYLWGANTRWRAQIAAILGERERAVALLKEAIAQGSLFSIVHPNIDLEGLRDFPPFRDFIRPRG